MMNIRNLGSKETLELKFKDDTSAKLCLKLWFESDYFLQYYWVRMILEATVQKQRFKQPLPKVSLRKWLSRSPMRNPWLIWFRKPFLVGLSVGDLCVDISERQEERMKKSLIFFIKPLFTSNVFAEAYSEPYQTSKMETFAKIVNSLKPLIACAKNPILDAWQA